MSRKDKTQDKDAEALAKFDAIDSYCTLLALINTHTFLMAQRTMPETMDEMESFIDSIAPQVQRVKKKLEAWRGVDAETEKEGNNDNR